MGAAAARSPAYVPPAANVPSTQRTTVPGIPIMQQAVASAVAPARGGRRRPRRSRAAG